MSTDPLNSWFTANGPVLSNMFNGVRGRTPLKDTTTERVYTTAIKLASTVDVTETSLSHVNWRLTRRGGLPKKPLDGGESYILRPLRYPDNMSEAVKACYGKKVSQARQPPKNFLVDFCALIHRGAQCLAHYSLTGELTYEIVGGEGLQTANVLSVGSAEGLSVIPQAAVYLPDVLRVANPGRYLILYTLATYAGATVAVDTISNIGGGSRVILPAVEAEVLARDLHDAVLYLLGLMDTCGGGADATLSLFAGLHSITTVIAHSNEGGLVRDILRMIRFNTPCGIVPLVEDNHFLYTTSFLPLVPSWSAMSGIWDYLTVVSAAAVHLSDPCVLSQGVPYPTTIIGVGSDPAANVRQQLPSLLEPFLRKYLRNLCALTDTQPDSLGDAIGNVALACRAVCSSPTPNRHLTDAIVAPWFWVESSGLMNDYSIFDSESLRCGYGPMAVHDCQVTVPGFHSAGFIGTEGTVDLYRVNWTTLRHCAALLHLKSRKGDGLAHVRMAEPELNEWMLDGRTARRREAQEVLSEDAVVDGEQVIRNHHSVDEYIWKSASTDLFHPAELTAVQSVDLAVDAWKLDGRQNVPTDMPSREVMMGTFTVTCSPIRLLSPPGGFHSNTVVYRRRCKVAAILRSERNSSLRNFDREVKVDLPPPPPRRQLVDRPPAREYSGTSTVLPITEMTTTRIGVAVRYDPSTFTAHRRRPIVDDNAVERPTEQIEPAHDQPAADQQTGGASE